MRLINRRPSANTAWVLRLLPFVLIIGWYLFASAARLEQNADDKLMPAPLKMAQTMERYVFEIDERTGTVLFWTDTAASLKRLLSGLILASLLGLVVGLTVGILPYLQATLSSFIAALSMVPPLSILPILLIIFGLGEQSKIVLIVIGVAPFIIRDIAQRSAELPYEQLIKIQSLGASTWQIIIRVVLPQILPRLIDSVRLSLGPAFLFLIAAEAISAQQGLGYRVFLMRRFLAMDVILPYVIWITLLAFSLDWLLKRLSQAVFPWYYLQSTKR